MNYELLLPIYNLIAKNLALSAISRPVQTRPVWSISPHFTVPNSPSASQCCVYAFKRPKILLNLTYTIRLSDAVLFGSFYSSCLETQLPFEPTFCPGVSFIPKIVCRIPQFFPPGFFFRIRTSISFCKHQNRKHSHISSLGTSEKMRKKVKK